MTSVTALGANWCVTIQYTKEHLSELLTELSAKGLHALTRPGHKAGLVYVFVSDPNDRVPEIVSNLQYVVNVVAILSPTVKEERQKLANRLVKQSLMISDKSLEELVKLTGSPSFGVHLAFEKYYTRCLMLLALVGVAFRLFAGKPAAWEFNMSYTILVTLWAIGFVTTWKNKVRSQYTEKLHYVPSKSQITPLTKTEFAKKLCFIPIALQFSACLIAFQFGCFLLEIFITQIYQGPFSGILALTPTVLISVYVPILTMVYDVVLNKLIAWENPVDPVQSRLEKKFILTFLTSYVPLFITLFVYLPMGHHVNAQLQSIAQLCSRFHIPVLKSGFKVNTGRYQSQYFFFMVTGQVIALCVENVVPFILAKALPKIKGMDKPNSELNKAEMKITKEYPEDTLMWKQATQSSLSAWGEFDINAMTTKLTLQFGYVAMFSCIWPLAPLCCVVFNLISMKLEIWRYLNKNVISSSTKNKTDDVSAQMQGFKEEGTFWGAILNVLLFISALVSPALVIMYKRSSGESLQHVLEKRDSWHLNSLVPVDWRTVLVGAFGFEHLTFFCYIVVAKFVGRRDSGAGKQFVRAKELEEPPHVDLNQVVKETAQFMDPNEEEKPKSTVASKGPRKTKDAQHGGSTPSVTTSHIPTDANRAKEAGRSSQAVNTGVIAPAHRTGSLNEKTSVSSQPMQTVKSSTSPVAGATVPDTIPTSKNFHLRNDQGSTSFSSNAENQNNGTGASEQRTRNVSTTSKPENTGEKPVPKVVTTSPSDEAVVGAQFIPPPIADTSKGHVANILNDVGPQEDDRYEKHADEAEYSSHDDSQARKAGDRQSDQSSSPASTKESQTSQGAQRSSEKTPSSKKKIKAVLSPLGKLKKKF
ncbi:LAFA_0F16556g1_1 [Lachancea sp. 'fantastica']|nr:LAFA_0F16556g1_1 [Lachancea sp. 'fantastica']